MLGVRQRQEEKKERRLQWLGDLTVPPAEEWACTLRKKIEETSEIIEVDDYTRHLSQYCGHKSRIVATERDWEVKELEKCVIEKAQIEWEPFRDVWSGEIKVCSQGMKHFRVGRYVKLVREEEEPLEVLVVDIDEKRSVVLVHYEPYRLLDESDDSDDSDDSDESFRSVDSRELLAFDTRVLPECANIQFIYDYTSSGRQLRAINELWDRQGWTGRHTDPKRRLLTAHLLGIEHGPSTSQELDIPIFIPDIEEDKFLDKSQKAANSECLARPVTLIQGPPGTGKTTTISAFVCYYLRMYPGAKILLCGPSNISTDQLAYAISRVKGINVVRYSSEGLRVIDPRVEDINVLTLCLKKCERFKELHKKRQERNYLNRKEQKEYHVLYGETRDKILDEASVICTTMSMAGSRAMVNRMFNCVLLDEVPQARESECIIPFVRASDKVVFVGDHMQLGATIVCPLIPESARISLFDRLLFGRKYPKALLRTQYRMHPEMTKFPSDKFYKGQIEDGITKEDRQVDGKDFDWPDPTKPMAFIDIDGKEEKNDVDKSFRNLEEALEVCRILSIFRENGIEGTRIGIITPYQGQRELIQSKLTCDDDEPDLQEWYDEIYVSTVDGFQGSEKDYIIISCVRNNSHDEIGFLKDERRLNVAITRARFGLIIVGCVAFLKSCECWLELIEHYEKQEPCSLVVKKEQSTKELVESWFV